MKIIDRQYTATTCCLFVNSHQTNTAQLENTVSEMLWQSYEIEVAPYEQQWGWILELLEWK